MFQYSTIPEAIEALRQGRVILCTDDPERENEGDMICAARFATTANVNLMASQAKGLICMPMSAGYIGKLGLPQMVPVNTDNHETAFTVSIDHVATSTGISAAERSITAMKCVEPNARPEDFRRPGHMFPLLAKPNGVLEREGHTDTECDSRVRTITGRLEAADSSIGEFQDDTVRQLVSSIRVLDRERLSIRFKDGTEIEQVIECVGRPSA